MTGAGDTQPLARPEGIPSKEDFEQSITELAALSPVAAFAPELRQTAVVALACGSTGWVFEWLLAPWLRPSAAPFGLPPLASIAFTVGIGVVLAMLASVAAIFVARLLSSGRLTAEVSGKVHVAAPVWWARGLIVSIGIAALFLAGGAIRLLSILVRDGHAAAANIFAAEIGDFLAMTSIVSLIGAFLMVIMSIIAKYAKRVRLFLLASDRLWLIKCVFETALYGTLFFIGLIGVAAVVEPIFAATILGSTLTPATIVATALFGAWGGFIMERSEWRDRAMTRMRERMDRPMDYLNDFRTWTIEPETSLTKTTADGYPLFMWRESADNRLGLSRPRYCCVVREGDELLFHFFDPVSARKSTGALAACSLVGGVAALWTLADYFILGHTTTRATAPFSTPPALIVLNAGLKAAIIGGLAAGLWYVGTTLLRWGRNRFEADGALYKWPWPELDNFRTLSAADAGATINGQSAKQGEGLAAILTDGTQIVLTANAWSHTTIAAYHTAMWKLFVDDREATMARFATQLKAEQRAVKSEGAPAASDIPSFL